MGNDNKTCEFIECPECEGKKLEKQGFFTVTCKKCQGKGKIDWVTNIMGSKPINIEGAPETNAGHLIKMPNPCNKVSITGTSVVEYNLNHTMDKLRPLIQEEVEKQVKKIMEQQLNWRNDSDN